MNEAVDVPVWIVQPVDRPGIPMKKLCLNKFFGYRRKVEEVVRTFYFDQPEKLPTTLRLHFDRDEMLAYVSWAARGRRGDCAQDSCPRKFFKGIEDFQTGPPEMPVVAGDNS